MNKSVKTTLTSWVLRCVAACGIAASLGAGSFGLSYAQEITPTGTPEPGTVTTTTAVADPTALTASTESTTFTCATDPCDHATITAYLSGIPAGAFSVVQWRDSAGVWHHVDTWQSALSTLPSSGVPFVKWAVLPTQYGTGPYRWVFYTTQNGALWGISPSFMLPATGGTDFAMFLTQPGKSFMKPLLGNPVVPATAPLLASSGSTLQFDCGGACDHSDITVFVPAAPRTAWISVQWLDGIGIWHDVEGWQGSFDLAAGSHIPFKQWTVGVSQYNQGPFRWVIYTQRGGDVWGISPNFMLPPWGGLKFASFLAPAPPTTTTGASAGAG